MKYNKKVAIWGSSAFALAILLGGTTAVVNAETPVVTIAKNDLVHRIAQKFGLNEAEVQDVFEQAREEREKEMRLRQEEHLSGLVTQGVITEAQKQLILQKREEIRKNMESTVASLKDKTPEERKAVFLQQKTELDAWAKANNIDVKYLLPFGKGKGMHGHNFGFNHMMRNVVN